MNFASLCEELYNWLNDTATDNEVIRPISKEFLNSCPKILKPLSYCNNKYLFLFFITTDWSTQLFRALKEKFNSLQSIFPIEKQGEKNTAGAHWFGRLSLRVIQSCLIKRQPHQTTSISVTKRSVGVRVGVWRSGAAFEHVPVQTSPSCLSHSLSSHSQNSPEMYHSCGEQIQRPQWQEPARTN